MRYRVVVADDSATVVELLQNLLEAQGMSVIPASDGLDALAAVHRHLPDLVVLDIQMPRMDGYQVCRLLKDSPDTAHIPIIALTTHAKASDVYWGHAAGADHYLSKDDDPEVLLKAIRSLLPTQPSAVPAEEATSAPSDSQVFAMVNDLLDRKLFAATICNDLARLGEQITDAEGLIERVLEQGLNVWDYDAGAILVRSPHLELIYYLFPKGEAPTDRQVVQEKFSTLLGEAGLPADVSGYQTATGAGRQAPVTQSLGRVRTWPMRSRGEIVGILCFAFRDPRRLPRRSEEAFDVFARQANILVDNALLYHGSNATARQLKELFDDLTRAQADLITSARMASIGQLSAGLAHELNNPLNFVYGNLSHVENYVNDLIKLIDAYGAHGDAEDVKEVKEDIRYDYLVSDVRKALQSCRNGAERCRRLVRDLRAFAKGEEIGAQPIDLNEGLETAINLVLRPYQSRIVITKNFNSMPPLLGIAGEIHQVFINLLTNACQAIPDRGEIVVSSRMVEGRHEVVIRDDGIGMAEDVLPRIFDPFYTTRRVGEGKGLGLSISYGIVSKHGGRIVATSRPNEGTTLRLELPTDGYKEPEVQIAGSRPAP